MMDNEFDWTYDIPTAMVQLTKENCEVGIVVRIAKTSEYYDKQTPMNPIDVNGIVTEVIGTQFKSGRYVLVKWPTATLGNCYNFHDLMIVDPE
jgi:hypothetical protein